MEKIKEASKKKENENVEFRSYLKNIDMSINEIDSIVHKIYNDVIEQIDCTECANCCNTKKPHIDDNDIKKFVSSLEINEEEFRKSYIEEIESEENKRQYEFNALPCPFLKNKKCTNYENRPEACKSYPHLHKSEFITRLWGVIDNYEVCPIVYNVYEELKNELWEDDILDDEFFDDYL